jgi:hypothetical protein
MTMRRHSMIEDRIVAELQRALETLRGDLDRVELWIGAWRGCTEPLPDYRSPYRRLSIPARDVSFRRPVDQRPPNRDARAQPRATPPAR